MICKLGDEKSQESLDENVQDRRGNGDGHNMAAVRAAFGFWTNSSTASQTLTIDRRQQKRKKATCKRHVVQREVDCINVESGNAWKGPPCG